MISVVLENVVDFSLINFNRAYEVGLLKH